MDLPLLVAVMVEGAQGLSWAAPWVGKERRRKGAGQMREATAEAKNISYCIFSWAMACILTCIYIYIYINIHT